MTAIVSDYYQKTKSPKKIYLRMHGLNLKNLIMYMKIGNSREEKERRRKSTSPEW